MTTTDTIHAEYDLPHPPAKVWRALTDSELIAKWLMANDLKPIVGHKFTLKAQPMQEWDGVVECEVLEVDAPNRLRYSWRGGPAAMRLDTVVAWTLTPTASGTKLVLDHSGFLPNQSFAFVGMSKGWTGHIADRLRDVLNVTTS